MNMLEALREVKLRQANDEQVVARSVNWRDLHYAYTWNGGRVVLIQSERDFERDWERDWGTALMPRHDTLFSEWEIVERSVISNGG